MPPRSVFLPLLLIYYGVLLLPNSSCYGLMSDIPNNKAIYHRTKVAFTTTGTNTVPNTSSKSIRYKNSNNKWPLYQQSNNDKDPSNLDPPKVISLANYHLIWSPNVLPKIALTTLSLWITNRSVPWESILHHYYHYNTNTNHNIMMAVLWNAVLPTLSSACCWIQLVLNVVTPAMGCAGFNTYFGPLRPFGLSLLLYLTWITRCHTRRSTMVVRWTMALLPEVLHLWNNKATLVRQRNQEEWKQRLGSIFAFAKKQSQNQNGIVSDSTGETTAMMMMTVYLDCPTMGCVACIQNVESSLRNAISNNDDKNNDNSIGQVHSAQTWLLDGNQKGGKAKVVVSVPTRTRTKTKTPSSKTNSGDEETLNPAIVSALVEAVETVGFPCTVDHVVPITITDSSR